MIAANEAFVKGNLFEAFDLDPLAILNSISACGRRFVRFKPDRNADNRLGKRSSAAIDATVLSVAA